MHEETLFTSNRTLDRPTRQMGGERRLRLVRHVFLAAKRSPIGHQLDGDRGLLDTQDCRDLVAVIPDALATGIDMQPCFGRDRQRRLGLQEGMLNPLRLVHVVHRERGAGECRIRVAAHVL